MPTDAAGGTPCLGQSIEDDYHVSVWCTLPIRQMACARLLGRPPVSVECVAERSWVIAGPETTIAPRAFFLPDQLPRVTGWEWMDEHPSREMNGGYEVHHAPTRAYLLRRAVLLDGVVYNRRACSHLQPRAHRWPMLRTRVEIGCGALCCTFVGNRYFAPWITDNCTLYPLAAAAGEPTTTRRLPDLHTRAYADAWGMAPRQEDAALFRELVVFDDHGQNSNKRDRFGRLCSTVQSKWPVESRRHPGVFVLRGGTGQRRVLRNEAEIADHLHRHRGFRILDPRSCDLPTLIAQCAGSEVVIGVEGSQLIHGYMHLRPGGAVVTLQPPNRFVSYYKHLADRDGICFGFVVGIPAGEDFVVDAAEVERTLDLLPSPERPPVVIR